MARGRQWGADRHNDPIRTVPAAAGEGTIAVARMAVVITFAAWLAFCVVTLWKRFVEPGANPPGLAETLIYVALVSALAYSALAYLIARLGFFMRTREHRRTPRALLDERLGTHAPRLTMIVPSYQEEAGVVRLTLLTAALQEYPDLEIVLLIDDPPRPRHAGPDVLRRSALGLPRQVESLLEAPAARFRAARERFATRGRAGGDATPTEIAELAAHYEAAVRWLHDISAGYEHGDNAEQFVAGHVLGRLAADLSVTAAALRGAADQRSALPAPRVDQLYARLVNTFTARLSSFERKRYTSLSHEPNKAMNLNSYIGLMGGRYREVPSPGGVALVDAGDGPADLVVEDPDYVLTLDADSVLLPEYCMRLVDVLEQPHNARIAVAQTPYSAYPGADTRLERIAGATTDVQHIVHQGMTHYGATFWVGANAVLRKRALNEIVETTYEGDAPVHRYIKDRTVIEDTESSIDLVIHDWQLLNVCERLSYSATPPDFGSLCIQRQRWANGGLLIAPKLLSYIRARRARGERNSMTELCLRSNYMMSICWTSISLPLLLVYQFDGQLLSPLVFLMAAPYFVAMSIDLRACGYKGLDVLRIYAFNLLLVAVNLAGWASSLAQGLTGSKGTFRRTPKVRSRTVPALLYVVFPYALIALSLVTLRQDIALHHWANAFFAAGNAALGAYAIVAFVGLRHSLADVWINVVSWLYVPAGAQRPAVPAREARPVPVPTAERVSDWRSVLYFGAEGAGEAPVPPATPTPTVRFPRREPAAPAAAPQLVEVSGD